ncbi:MAG: response regulator, partial [Polyangiaceae bacterium]
IACGTGPSMTSAAKSKLVLIVDDEDDVRELLALLLERDGYRVKCACDGDEGLERAKALKPDLVITDHVMPGLSGLQLVRAMAQIPGLATTKIILVTGAPRAAVLQDAAGPIDIAAFLPKPSTWKIIRETVHACLGDGTESPPSRDLLTTSIGETK